MASTKKFNKETGQWEVFGSTDAVDIKLADLQGNFTSDNVEGALREASSQISDMSASVRSQKATMQKHASMLKQHAEDIEWLKEFGGGGGGGGGTAVPTITSTFADGTIVDKDTDVIIPIFFSSPNMGEGTAYIIIDGIEVDSIPNIKQGNNKINIGKLSNLKNEVAIYVKDRANLLSNQLLWNIICGGLDVELDFDSTADYTISDIITMQYKITSASDEAIIMHMTIDYDTYEIECIQGVNEYTFKGLGVGIHKINFYVESGPYKSKNFEFNIIIVNSNSLYVSTLFQGGDFEYGYPIAISYRISKASTEQFNVRFLLDGKLVKTAQSGVGSYYWTLNSIELGTHTWSIEVIGNQDEQQTISGEFNVVQGEYTPVQATTAGLAYRLNAEGRTNTDSDKENPVDNSGNGIKATLHNFNFFSNGWMDNSLVCDGNAYVEIDYYPWQDNAIYGSTFEIQFKGIDIGISEARILDYTDIDEPFKGAFIELEKSLFKSLASTGEVSINADTWMTVSFVIDRRAKFGKIFIDGVCSRAFVLSDTGSGTNAKREDFTHAQKIYLNSRKGEDKFGACEIKDVRIYNRALSDDEILTNFISQEKDFTKQKMLYDKNYNNKTLPTIHMYCDISKMTDKISATTRIKYTSPNEERYGQSFDLPYCQVCLQGTSSLQYVLKNFTARLKDESMAPFYYSPYPNGVKEDVFCFKADYMESTHSRNVGLARFVNDCLYDEKNPAQKQDPNVRNAVDGFPCLMYINDELQGIYNFNLDRYSTRSYGYTEDTTLVYEVAANSDTTAGAFYKWTEASGKSELDYYSSDFICLYPPTRANGADNMEELIRLVEWVNDSSDEDFKDNMPRYFNIQYLLRYFLYVYVVGAVDSLGKNMKLTTWDGQIWYPQVYDADTTIGLDNSGFMKFDMDIEMGDEHVFNTTGSVLWRRVRELFAAELNAQYAIMRQKQFTVENMMKYILEEQIQKIPAKYYNIDMQTKYLNFGSEFIHALHGSSEHFIRKWLQERLLYCDTLFGYTATTSDYITLRSSKLGYVYLDIQTYVPMYLRIKWRNEANNAGVQTKRIGRGETVRFEYNMPTETDQEIIVYGGHYLKSLGDVSNLQCTTMLIANADRLTEIECHSPNLINTDLSSCTKLQKIDISDCPSLGVGIGAQSTLNIQNCNYLRYCNCMNTGLTAIYTMQKGGNLKEIYYPLSTQVVQLTNQTYLERIGLPFNEENDEYCKSLATVQISNCNRVKTLHYPFNEDDEINFKPFKYVQDLSILNSLEKLDSITFAGFNKLKTISLQALPNLSYIKFDDMMGINDVSTFESILVENVPKIKTVTFNISDNTKYKAAFVEGAIIDLGGALGVESLSSNAESLEGLNRVIIPTTTKIINFPYSNNIKSIITGTSDHVPDKDWEGYDFKDAIIEDCDLSGIKITHAENFYIKPTAKLPTINKNKDKDTYVTPTTGVYDLTTYTGDTLSNVFAGFDFSGEFDLRCDADLVKITDINEVFKGSKLDVTKTNNLLRRLPNLNEMVSTFAFCSNIKDPRLLNIPNNVQIFNNCFEGSDVEKDIAFKPNAIGLTNVFKDCKNLKYVTTNWNTEYENLFDLDPTDCYAGCHSITHFDDEPLVITKYETGLDRVPIAWGGEDFLNENTGIYEIEITAPNSTFTFPTKACLLDNGRIKWGDGTVTEGVISHVYKNPGTYIIKGKCSISNGDTATVETVKRTLTKIHKVPAKPLSYRHMFDDCRNLIYADLSCMNATDLSYAFKDCIKLQTVILGNMTNCKTVDYLFQNCIELSSVNNMLITNKCTKVSYTFNNCKALKEVKNMELWDMSAVQSMNYTFDSCGIRDLKDIKNWNLKSCKSMLDAFKNTSAMKIDVSGWIINEDSTVAMNELFKDNKELRKINVSNLVTNKVQNITSIFSGCTKIEEIIGLSTWDTSDLRYVSNMFNGIKLTNIDLSNWDFSVMYANMYSIWGETNPKTIVLNNIKWDDPAVVNKFLYESSYSGDSKATKIVMDEIREDMTNFQGMFKNLNLLTEDIRFPDWAINVSECFKNCSGLRDIVSNWNTEYTQLENCNNCYQGTNIRTIDGEDDRVTSIPPEWGGLTFNDDDTLVIEIDTNLNTNKSLTVKFTVTGEGAILWGDNSDNDLDVANTSSTSSFTCTHTYAEHGIYTVKIKKTRLGSKEGTPVVKILSVPYSHKANHTKDYGILNSYAYNTYGEFYNVTEIDVSNLALNNDLIDCSGAFYGMKELTTIIGLDELNYSKVKDMSNMFYNCYKLSSVDMRNWDVTSVTDRTNMFENCNDLTNIDVTGMKLGRNLSGLFYEASMVTSITGLNDLTVGIVTDTSYMFYNCNKLKFDSIVPFLQKINSVMVTNMSRMFNNVELTDANVQTICEMYNNIPSIDILGSQSFLTDVSIIEPILDKADWSTLTDISNLFLGWSRIVNVSLLEKYDVSNITNMSSLFKGCFKLEDINGIKDWKVSKVEDMSDMFNSCDCLADLTPLKKWDVSSVKTMKGMFSAANYSSIKTLSGLEDWDVRNVTNMQSMFHAAQGFGYSDATAKDCSALANWDVRNVTTMNYMFGGFRIEDYSCLADWNISSLTDFAYMFAHHWAVETDSERVIDLSSWDVSKVDFGRVGPFFNCKYLVEVESFKNISDTATYIGTDSNQCEMLSIDSIMSFINNLVEANTTHILYIGEMNVQKLTEDQILIAINKGWTLL